MFYFHGPCGFFFMLEVKLRNSTSIKLMNYCIGKKVQVILCLFSYSGVLHILTIYLMGGRNFFPFAGTWSSPPFFGGSVLLIFLVLCIVCVCVWFFLFFFCSCVLFTQRCKIFMIVHSSVFTIVYCIRCSNIKRNMTDTFEHIIVLSQIKFHPLINAKHIILYTIEISPPWQAILNIIFW